jgi:hypothetical protein
MAISQDTYRLVDGRVRIQIEDLLGTTPGGGWVYQAPGQGNPGAEGAHYYYKSQTAEGSYDTVPQDGRFSFTFEAETSGAYAILLRAARDTNDPGDARNDVWIKVDDGTQGVMPIGTPALTPGGEGFVKFKGGLGQAWRNADQFSTPVHGDTNPKSTVVLEAGTHTVTFAPRSTGIHIDSVQIVSLGPAPLPPKPPTPEPPAEPPVLPEDAPLVRVWLGHDGYRDADDNLAMLLGAAQARVTAKAGDTVRVAGVVFGDTKDGGQYYMLNPEGTAPAAFGTDERYGDVSGNYRAVANHAFFNEYGLAALRELGPGWTNYDLLADDAGGLRTWSFHAATLEELTPAAAAMALDIVDAITLTAGAEKAAKIVVYSAGGGANVAAEAIGYLLGQGYDQADLVKHFAVVQHGNNWVTNYEDEARELTRDFTIAITNQNYDLYGDGRAGPDLKHAIPDAGLVDASGFGAAFGRALAVATGAEAFGNPLPAGAIFRSTLDASDAGSHAVAVDAARLLAAWDNRLGDGELHTGYAWSHLIDDGASGLRARLLYDGFDAEAIAEMLVRGVVTLPDEPDPVEPITVSATIADGGDDAEFGAGTPSDDLNLGLVSTLLGMRANPTGLRFTGLEIDPDADITEAYLLFHAKRDSTDTGTLAIELEASRATAGFAGADPFVGRGYLAEAVAWEAPGAWQAGEFYRSPDLSALLEGLLGTGGLAAGDALGFRIAGGGARAAHSFESTGVAPQLVVTWQPDAADEVAQAAPPPPAILPPDAPAALFPWLDDFL